jgi:hypothetical protein
MAATICALQGAIGAKIKNYAASAETAALPANHKISFSTFNVPTFNV